MDSILPRLYFARKIRESINEKAHFSNLIYSGQLTKDEALEKLKAPIYPPELLEEDKEFVIKKFGLTETSFKELMALPRREHADFATTGTAWDNYPPSKGGENYF